MIPLPALTFAPGGGGPAVSSAANQLSTPFAFAFNFDSSAWVINNKSSGSTTASGNKDANAQSLTPQSVAGAVLGKGNLPLLLLGAAAAWYFLR